MITIFASLELVQLDASEVYSLLTALNRPEVSSAINELQEQLRAVQDHIEDAFKPSEAETAHRTIEGEKPRALWSMRFLSSSPGLMCSAQPPEVADSAVGSNLVLFWTPSILRLQTVSVEKAPILAYPEFHASLRLIEFEIQKGAERGNEIMRARRLQHVGHRYLSGPPRTGKIGGSSTSRAIVST